MKTILVEAHDTPLVTFAIANHTGTSYDPKGSEGLVYHSAELSLRGAGARSREQFDADLDALGASLGYGLGRDYLALRGTCLSRHLDAVFDMAASVLGEASFDKEEHEQLRREAQYDLDEMRDDDGSLAHRFFAKHCHPGYVYGRTALGTSESIKGLELPAVEQLYPRLFAPQDLLLGVAGPLRPDQVDELATRLPGTPAKSLEQPSLEVPALPTGRRLVLVDKPERQQCQILMGHLMPAYGSADFDELQVAETAFGGMFSARLMQEIRVKHGWSYGAHCSIGRARGPFWLQLGLAPAAEVAGAALARTLEMYEELIAKGLSQEEFDFSLAYLSGSAAFSQATARQRLNRRMQEDILALPPHYGDQFPDRLQATDCDRVNRAVAKHMSNSNLCVVVVCTVERMRPEFEKLGFDSIEIVDHRSY